MSLTCNTTCSGLHRMDIKCGIQQMIQLLVPAMEMELTNQLAAVVMASHLRFITALVKELITMDALSVMWTIA